MLNYTLFNHMVERAVTIIDSRREVPRVATAWVGARARGGLGAGVVLHGYREVSKSGRQARPFGVVQTI